MELSLIRHDFSDRSTIGSIFVDQASEALCFTLELPNKDGLPGSCIPQGRYPVVLAPSPKFQQSLDPWVQRYAGLIPHIIRIPNRTNILLHWGNSEAHTEGCVLVGLSHPQAEFVGTSRAAFEKLWDLIAAAAL